MRWRLGDIANPWPSREVYDDFAERGVALMSERGNQGRVVGSYAAGSLAVPFSDLDFVLVGGPGDGPRLRDEAAELAGLLGEALCVTVDPFATEAIIYAEYRNGLHADWFIVERHEGVERSGWRGDRPFASDVVGRAWSTLLYVLSAALRTDEARWREIAARELAQHWVWLALQDFEVAGLPYVVPTAGEDLVALVKQTAAVLPYREGVTELIEARLRTPPI